MASDPDLDSGSGGVDADPGTADDEYDGLSPRLTAAVLVAAVGVVGSGVADFAFAQLGAPATGALVWVVGYGTTALALWYLLVRPIDFGAT